MTMLSNKVFRAWKIQRAYSYSFIKTIIAVIVLSHVTLITASPYVSSKTSDLPKPEAWTSTEEVDDEVDDYIDIMQKIIAGIIAFVIVVVVVCLFLCFCCPICIIAKMRQRRGAVIRTAAGTTTTTNGNTVTVTVNRTTPLTSPATVTVAGPQVVAISNNLNARNKPYPVQESVTVVPLIQPQMAAQYHPVPQPMNVSYPAGPAFPQNFELPPPYPGLPRDTESSNLPYNPYFTGDNEFPSAPPPK